MSIHTSRLPAVPAHACQIIKLGVLRDWHPMSFFPRAQPALYSSIHVLTAPAFYVLQAFGAESTAVIAGLPSLQDSANFFQTQSAGPADANLEAMEPDHAGSSSQADDVAQAMDETDAAPASTTSAGKAAGGLHSTPAVCCF